jgi:hypothetical protein
MSELRERETRIRVLVRATMLCQARQEVCIQNVSSGGMMLIAARPPKRGDYVEIHLKARALVGYVVWSSDRRFGVKLRQRIVPQSFLPGFAALDDDLANAPSGRYVQSVGSKRRGKNSQHYRALSAAIQFSFLVLLAAGSSAIAGASIFYALHQALAPVAHALG